MLIFEQVYPLNNHLKDLKKQKKSIGFVATMGALHSGHISLVRQAKARNSIVVVSIFVNPTQFNKQDDLIKYPRNTERDKELLKEVDCDIVFIPTVEEMYPNKVEPENIDLNGLDLNMEGSFRSNHFDGVATVVKRFFEIINPDQAYFGLKDFQQYLIVKHISKVLNLGPEVVGLEIERNEKGLALSSRNQRLSVSEQNEALMIYKSIAWAKENYKHFSPSEIKKKIHLDFEKSNLKLEYVEICDPHSLKEISQWSDFKEARIFIAANHGKVRLIDNDRLF